MIEHHIHYTVRFFVGMDMLQTIFLKDHQPFVPSRSDMFSFDGREYQVLNREVFYDVEPTTTYVSINVWVQEK